jgi:hypothetical protein
MIRSVFVAGTAMGVLALGSLTAAAGNAHARALTHVAKSGTVAGEEKAGTVTALTQGALATATDAQNAGAAHAQAETQAPAQTQAQDEDTTENDDAAENDTAENDTTENDDAAEQAAAAAQQPAHESDNENAPTGGGGEDGGD